MKKIELTQNKFAIVDDQHFEWLNQWKWHAVKAHKGVFYAARSERVAGKQRRVWLHRLLLGLQLGEECDHRNGDGLDNRIANIRIATRSENNRNRGRDKRNKSGYTGVSWNSKSRQWQAHAIVNGRWTTLGFFTSKDDAILARRRAEIQNYDGFSREAQTL